MTSTTNTDLQIPYEIRHFIASQVPHLNWNSQGNSWAIFTPNATPINYFYQMKQGILLEVVDDTHKPLALCTRYGSWQILGSSMGSFEKVFEVVKQRLNLRKVEELSQENRSFWAVQSWNGVMLDLPIMDKKEEFIPSAEAYKICEKFIKQQCEL